MTYTDFVSTLNHRVKRVGYRGMLEDISIWFNPEMFSSDMIAYAVGLIEYCSEKSGLPVPEQYVKWLKYSLPNPKYPRHAEVMRECIGNSYIEEFEKGCIEAFKKHNVFVMEVGNVV